MDANSPHLRNVSEDLVDLYIDECMKGADMCTCSRCRSDVKACALNDFPPHYVVTEFGDVMTRTLALSNQFRADMITSIMKAVIIVKARPRHD